MKLQSFFITLSFGAGLIMAVRANADDAAAMMSTNTNFPANPVEIVTNSPAAATNPPVSTNVVMVPSEGAAPATAAVVVYPDETTNSLIVAPPTPYRRWSAGLEAGTTGYGFNARWHISDLMGVSAAYDHMAFSWSGTIEDNFYNSHVRMMSVPVTADFYPLHNDYFHVSAGILFNMNHYTGTSTGTIDLDGTPYAGTARLDIKQRLVDPYFAVGGNYYFTKNHHLSMGGEIGLIYTGTPRVNLTLNPPNGAVETQRQAEEDKIRHYARWAQVWPVLKLSLNYSF
jgi:hypothetical protein